MSHSVFQHVGNPLGGLHATFSLDRQTRGSSTLRRVLILRNGELTHREQESAGLYVWRAKCWRTQSSNE